MLEGQIPASTLKRFRPVAVIAFLDASANPSNGNRPQVKKTGGTLDGQLGFYAKGRGLSLGYLEDAADSLAALFSTVTAEDLEAYLQGTSDSFTDIVNKIAQAPQGLVDCYRASDIACFEKQDTSGLESLLTQRNFNWIPVIKETLELSSGPTFIVVGLLHLVGKDSVLELLQKEGFTIERVQF